MTSKVLRLVAKLLVYALAILIFIVGVEDEPIEQTLELRRKTLDFNQVFQVQLVTRNYQI